MAGRRRESPAIHTDGNDVKAQKSPRLLNSPCDPAPKSMRELPQWMRLYFYGMHGVTLDVLISSVHGLISDGDPKLVGFSSPFRCIMHSLTNFALEKIYLQKKSFKGRPFIFHLVFYPSIYIGLQILLGNINTLADRVRVVSGTQLVLHYILTLYYTHVFYPGLSRLRYHCPERTKPEYTQGERVPDGLPDSARFLFFGMHGFLDEVIFTSIFNVIETSDRTQGGHTSLWSFLMYGSCSFVVEKLYMNLHFKRGWGTCHRLPIYIFFIYTWEFTWGLILRAFDACSWDYSHYPFNFMGLITLLYLPGWFCLSLYQDTLSNVLLRIKCTKDEEELADKATVINGQPESTF
ncbi:transmembrane protein 229A [Aplochiton taeniatus]